MSPTMSGPARIELTPAGDASCTFPYSPAIVEGIKAMVPAYCRAFDLERRAWIVASPYIDRVVDLITNVFPDAIVDARLASSPGSGPGAIDPDYAALHLQPTAPPELVDLAYRFLARIHHPDAGGNTATMQRLNAARDAIRSRAS